jgi:RNA polymerase sigma-70 factor (ECF subfamily)
MAMEPHGAEQHLSKIATLWTLVHKAHAGQPEDVGDAQKRLLERYGGAVHRYLLGALRDEDAADELFQEFCLRFLRGDFKNADPKRGRFRDYVRTAMIHLVVNHQRRQNRQRQFLDVEDSRLADEVPPAADTDRAFLDHWREELLAQTWRALEAAERQSGNRFYTVLRLRTDLPTLSSAELAGQLSRKLDREISVVNTRTLLSRARNCFADLLLREVEGAAEYPPREQLYQELIDLDLLGYCKEALKRRNLG